MRLQTSNCSGSVLSFSFVGFATFITLEIAFMSFRFSLPFTGEGLARFVSFAPNGAASGSSSVTITGLNCGAFGFTPSAGLVSGSELCSTTSWLSGTAVQCRSGVPTTLSSQSHAVVTVSGVVGTRGSRFTFDGRDAGGRWIARMLWGM